MIKQHGVFKKWWYQPGASAIAAWLAGGLLVRSIVAAFLPPGFDEAYYYLYTLNRAWSYFDHPMMVALSTGFGPWLTGEVSQFTIRLGALLLFTGALMFLYLTSLRLFSAKAAGLTLAIASLIPIFQFGFGILTLPDSPLIFFWSATLYIAAGEFFRDTPYLLNQSHQHEQPPYQPSYRLAIIGLLVGLACLSKYHGLALGAGLVGFCVTQARYRAALVSPWMLLALGLFLLAIAPIVIWNVQHDWISLRYQSGRAVPDRGYSLLELLGVFLVGVLYLLPSFGFPLWWVSLQTAWKQWKARGRGDGEGGDGKEDGDGEEDGDGIGAKNAFLLWVALPLMLVFTLMGGYRQILPTWAMPGFWGATLLLGNQAVGWQARSPKAVRRWLWGSGLFLGALLTVALLHLNLGTLQKPSRFAWFGGIVPVQADSSVQLLDIQQVRRGFAESPGLKQALEKADFVFTNEIFLSGQIGMAIAPFNPPPILCFNDDLRGFAFWSTAEEWVGKSGLYVTSSRQAEAEQYAEYFQSIQKLDEFSIQRGGVTVDTIRVYEAQNLLKPYPRPYGKALTGKALR